MADVMVLLVDDDKTILDALKQQIRRMFGATVACETAEDVAEAWEVLEDLSKEGVSVILVVSDWLMPDVRGDEFLADLQRRHPNIVRVMLTGQADAEALRRVRADGLAHSLLFKPWNEKDLREALSMALDG